MNTVINLPTGTQLQEIAEINKQIAKNTSDLTVEISIDKVDIVSVNNLLYYDESNNALWGTAGNDLKKSIDNGESWQVVGSSKIDGVNSITELFVTSKGTIIAATDSVPSIFRSTNSGVSYAKVFDWNAVGSNSYLLSQAICEYPNFDGNGNNALFICEYTSSTQFVDGKKMRVIRSVDDGVTWSIYYEEEHMGDGVRHWHFVQYDEWSKCVWLGSGDLPQHNKLYKITGDGAPELCGMGTYDWKFVSVVCDKNFLFCGSDRTDKGVAELFPVYIYCKATKKLSILGYNDGQAWYSCYNKKHRLPFWGTQINAGIGNTSKVQYYVSDYHGTYLALEIPNFFGNSVTPSPLCFSGGDYIFIQLYGTDDYGNMTGFMRLKISK